MRNRFRKFISPLDRNTKDEDIYIPFAVPRFICIIAYTVLAIACLVLIGWQFDINIFKFITPRFPGMNPFTALCFISISLWQLLHLRLAQKSGVWVHVCMFILAAFVLVVSSLRLFDLAYDTHYGVESSLYTSKLKYGFISPVTAALFFDLSIAMLLSFMIRRTPNLILLFAAPVLFFSAISLFGYLIGENDIFTMRPFQPMSLQTTLCFLAMSCSFTFLFSGNTFVQVILKNDSGGYIARNLLPYIFFIPLTLGFFRYMGEKKGLYDTGFGVAITIVGAMFAFLIIMMRQSYLLSKIDSQRKEAERKVQQHAMQLEDAYEELEQRNKELEQFSYVSSHDLQELLRKITLQGDMMKAMDYEKLTTTSQKRLDKILSAAYRMRTALRDVVRFSTLNKDLHFEPVDMNRILSAVQSDLRTVIEEKQAILKLSKLPSVNAVRWQIYLLLYNLVDNALKFSKENTPPTIIIDCSMTADAAVLAKLGVDPSAKFYHLSVIDDGIGFKQEMAEKIFIMFQRLHGKHEYPGTGTGLAICKKVVQNHDGYIWAESEPGAGATFHVLLPAQ